MNNSKLITYLLNLKSVNEREKENIINQYLNLEREYLEKMDDKMLKEVVISELNYLERSQLMSCAYYKMFIKEGDVCYIDFGKGYNQEIGFLHFGLVIRIFNSKALVLPMTSNPIAYNSAYDKQFNPNGMTHLIRVGQLDGLVKNSVVFLNDLKFINTARIIEIKGHMSTNSPQYHRIIDNLLQALQLDGEL